jgi:hypothetical protein
VHTLASLIQSILERGKHVNPLLSVPWMHEDVFRIDWLHAVDQGIAADILGNLCLMFRRKMPGNNVDERHKMLWQDITSWYEANHVQEKLHNLTKTMIQKAGATPPKLRGQGAQIRALIPWAKLTADRLLDSSQPIEAAAKQCMDHLHTCYSCLSEGAPNAAIRLREAGRKLCLQYVALQSAHTETGVLWRTKPKLHLFIHLVEELG